MITLQSTDYVLKTFYLDAVTEYLNGKINPFLARIKKTETDVVGKDVQVVCRPGIHGGFVAGSEMDDLPKTSTQEFLVLTSSLKNLYGMIEISDKAIRASAKKEGAMVSLLDSEIESLVKSAKINFGRMLFGDGSGQLAKIESYESYVFTLDTIQNVFEGMYVDVVLDGTTYKKLKITTIDRENKKVFFSSDDDIPDSATEPGSMYLHNSKNNEITGLKAIFSKNELYNLDRASSFMQPHELDLDDYVQMDRIQEMMDRVELASGKKVDFIVCSHGVKRALMRHFREIGLHIPTMKLESGDIALDYFGVPIVADRFCPAGEMYLLTTECFKLCQLCDWQWLEAEDGKILKQIPGKAAYTATLVKYAELICDTPCAQARIINCIEE